MRPIITVDNVCKQYRIGGVETSFPTLRDALAGAVAAPLRRLRGGARKKRGEMMQALRGVSFEVAPGEIVGVIGQNGAGKSTLLKILSRITEPTAGRVDLYGRVGSLLEVGTGFHPELTGRENLFLSGAILGMSRREIERKFDEIVEFSEIGKYIDTPVKHYSSGMYMRLAFSVAAHLEPEILLVDEVLAVGDVSFQRKCLDHMSGLRGRGVTILLVSHNMAAIQSACRRALFLDRGVVAADGPPPHVINEFREAMRRRGRERNFHVGSSEQAEDADVVITGFDMAGADGASRRRFRFGEAPRIRIDLRARRRVEMPLINFGIKRGDGTLVTNFNNWYDDFKVDYVEGECSLEGELPPLRLIPYSYEIHLLVFERKAAHASGDLSAVKPLAYITVGDFSISGPPLTEEDGIFQEPARRWVLTRGGERIASGAIDAGSLARAYADQPQIEID
ncbi:MAG TPA: ABC transporter ATP-binding protein [Pyrinomonadaceae bacterium]|jgi:lipopolysaccharide transport system ATP-binding protein